jgi:glycosyltransferase involved in cell wall biosynthesis
MGVPVVAANTGGASEIIEPGRSGALVRAGDQMQLVRSIEQLVTDRPLRRRLADAGRDRVRSFGAARMAEELLGHLERIGRKIARQGS